MKRLGCTILLLPGGFLAFFLLTVAPHLFAPPVLLVVGWVPAAGRLARAWQPGPVGVVLFVLAALVLVVGGHGFLRWLVAGLRKTGTGDSAAAGQWRWKWTVCGFGLAFCVLAAVVSVVLTVHQLYWMSKSTEPWFVNRTAKRLSWLNASSELQAIAETNQWDSAKTRTAFWKMTSYWSATPAWEVVQPVWVEKDARTLRAIVLVPRELGQGAVGCFTLLQPGTNYTVQQLEVLPQALASLGVGPAEQEPAARAALLP